MADAEVKATASLDDKITPGLAKISGHLDKFALSADGITSKLARSFSATDLAVGAIIGTFVKLNQTIDQTSKAYMEFSRAAGGNELTRRFDELEKAIKANDIALGESASGWKLFWKEREKEASDFMRYLKEEGLWGFLTGRDLMPVGTATVGAAVPRTRKIPTVPNAPPGYNPGYYDTLPDETYSLGRSASQRNASRSDSRQFFDPGAFPDTGLGDKRWFASYNRYKGGVPDMNIQEPGGLGMNLGKAGDAADRQLAANERLADSMMKAQKYTDTLAQGLSATFSGMLFDGMKLSDGLKGIFRGLVDDILGELSAKAASSIVKAVLTLADTGGGAVGVQVGPAAMNTTLQTLDYQRARGR